ncbi:MAG: CARDB domain-containing protein, partial [Candidatus Binatia bacterium]
LDPGESADVGCSQQISGRPSGANYIWGIADVNKAIEQEIATNNRRSTLFTVSGEPSDLVVENLSLRPAAISNGSEVRVSVTVRNDGEGTALASTTRVRINQSADVLSPLDPTVCNIATPSLDAGEDIDLQCEKTISSRPPGTNYVWVVADVNRTAGQLDTANDRTNTPLEIAAESSDLVIDSVVLDPVAGPNGERVSVTATIRNQGTRKSSSSITRVRMNQNPDTVTGTDLLICDPIDTASIEVGATRTASCEAEFEGRPAGLNYIWVIADTGDTAGQADRTNDRAKAEFMVDPPLLPDLTVTTLTVNPASAANGKSITITARIANTGEGRAQSSKTRFLISGSPDDVLEGDTVLCDQVSTNSMPTGTSTQVSCKPTIVDRPY